MAAELRPDATIDLGHGLTARRDAARRTLVIALSADADAVLHWGLRRGGDEGWRRPPEAAWPAGSAAADDGRAVRTPFSRNGAAREVTVPLDALPSDGRQLVFVVHFPAFDRWLHADGGADFAVAIPPARPKPAPDDWAAADATSRTGFEIDGVGRLDVGVRAGDDAVRVRLSVPCDDDLLLHWGYAGGEGWSLPPEPARPAGSRVFDDRALQSPFAAAGDRRRLEITLPRAEGSPLPRGLAFVLFRPADGRWLKSGGADLHLPLRTPRAAAPGRAAGSRPPPQELDALAARIIEAETQRNSWTLMHRFQLCRELLDGADGDPDALAMLFAWLRYSATRHLDWQRNYNTKPRDLAHAQDRLTARIAEVWAAGRGGAGDAAEVRAWARRMLTTLGRGGDGQRVRDGILEIMHRNHIKEAAGHFVEEWHQKLHNNTTPDDVVICEAYLAFLRADGDAEAFYSTLQQGGVTRQRLRGFERPIRTDPEFWPDKRDALIGEFEGFLQTLRAVHSSTDLASSAAAAAGRLDPQMHARLTALRQSMACRPPSSDGRSPAVNVDPAATAAEIAVLRRGVADALAGEGDPAGVRDLLLLDLSLEDLLRRTVESAPLSKLGVADLSALLGPVLDGVALAAEGPEPGLCAAHWAKLQSAPPTDPRDRALHAKSVADRVGRWIASDVDAVYRRLQPHAERLGRGFGAPGRVVELFSEEVVRGGPTFPVSLLLHRLDPLLREAAGLGGWQVISPGSAAGKLRLVDKLIAVQGERFAEPAVVIADAVGGNEEIPEGVSAVITCDTPDLVSHVAVRARNAGVLFATCFDRAEYERIKALAGRALSLSVSPAGDVTVADGAPAPRPTAAKARPVRAAGRKAVAAPPSAPWVLSEEAFAPGRVGGKSLNLAGLRGRVPEWIRLPKSLALPFGTFERTLADPANRALRDNYESLLAEAETDRTASLDRVRSLLTGLHAPDGLRAALTAEWDRAALPEVPWNQAWRSVCRVWASKWNERAYLSRRARGVPDDDLLMAVLIQQVVPADYAFVIHTVNPFSGDRGELYAEVVAGLGETLVGNYPGRAMGFTARQSDKALTLLSYPGKNVALSGRGVIFRSDSNGEDLEGFAGAGLYESVPAEEPVARVVDYSVEPLVWDPAFRRNVFARIAELGWEIGRTLGAPQDIEGVVAGGEYFAVQTRPQVGLG